MGLSRRIFTKEVKLAAVQRLEQGVSIGEVGDHPRCYLGLNCNCRFGGASTSDLSPSTMNDRMRYIVSSCRRSNTKSLRMQMKNSASPRNAASVSGSRMSAR